jgi:hypothetical protein
MNLTNNEKIARLETCIALLQDVDVMMQEVLGVSEECYKLHNTIQNAAEDMEDQINALKEAA